QEYLERHVWWWRAGTDNWSFDHRTFTTKMLPTSTDTRWKRSLERTASKWELVRRLKRDQDMPPFPDLSPSEQSGLENAAWIERASRKLEKLPPKPPENGDPQRST